MRGLVSSSAGMAAVAETTQGPAPRSPIGISRVFVPPPPLSPLRLLFIFLPPPPSSAAVLPPYLQSLLCERNCLGLMNAHANERLSDSS